MTKRLRGWCLWASAVVLAIGAGAAHGPAVAAGDHITGVVTSAAGPEAGVWVIAETSDFDASFRKIVVTDDAGRFLVPDLPAAGYDVWVRGYGLADSEKHAAEPGDDVRPAGDRRRRHHGRRPRSTRPTTGIRCSRCHPPATSPGPGRAATVSAPR